MERKVVEQRLQRAHADGQLNLDELDIRLAEVWQAKTRGDLAVLTVDLPPVPMPPSAQPQPIPVRMPPPRRRKGRTALRVLATIWASISALNFAIWLIVSITDFHLHYPWFIWVVGPWGAVLGVIWLSVNADREPGTR